MKGRFFHANTSDLFEFYGQQKNVRFFFCSVYINGPSGERQIWTVLQWTSDIRTIQLNDTIQCKILFYISGLDFVDISTIFICYFRKKVEQHWVNIVFSFKMVYKNLILWLNAGPPVSFEGKKVFKKAHFFKKRFFSLMIKPLKYADRLKGTPCDQG